MINITVVFCSVSLKLEVKSMTDARMIAVIRLQLLGRNMAANCYLKICTYLEQGKFFSVLAVYKWL